MKITAINIATLYIDDRSDTATNKFHSSSIAAKNRAIERNLYKPIAVALYAIPKPSPSRPSTIWICRPGLVSPGTLRSRSIPRPARNSISPNNAKIQLPRNMQPSARCSPNHNRPFERIGPNIAQSIEGGVDGCVSLNFNAEHSVPGDFAELARAHIILSRSCENGGKVCWRY